MTVSIFNGFNSKEPIAKVRIKDWLLSNHFKEAVEAIRREKSAEKRRKMKSSLPCITPSGVFAQRGEKGLLWHSGLLCVDIDGADNPNIVDWEDVKADLSEFEGCFYVGLSTSGQGVFMLVKIAHPRLYREYYEAISFELLRKGIVVDPHCRDVARLRCASYDPHPIFNPEVGSYHRVLHRSASIKDRPKSSLWQDRVCDNNVGRRVARLVEIIEQSHTNIAEDYSTWFRIGCALADEFGELGRSFYHRISAMSYKYRQQDCDKQYDKCLSSCTKIKIGTFFLICKSYNVFYNE